MSLPSSEFPDRKRGRDVDEISESLDCSHLAKKPSIQSLSLEAIFHPKFENENREVKSIRNEMKEKVNAGKGYLEVSLKHSGNLLLWSGSQRYYSKNSTSNAFTYVGELLLRQHFFRSWYGSKSGEEMYQECSAFVEMNRLTLAFEAVTSILGHHGDLPKKDFLILTAVADRSVSRFYTTVEVLEFAQRYRLPHNDLWIHTTSKAVDQLFTLYDSIRETGYAGETINALISVCDSHVISMYPHVDFQGEILEGIVIRYVSFNGIEMAECLKRLDLLAGASTAILKEVPVNLPMAFELIQHGDKNQFLEKKVISTNVREVYNSCIDKEGYKNLTTRVGDVINDILKATDSLRRTTIRDPVKDWDIPQLANSILNLNSSVDEETKRIATLITKLDKMNASVRYPVFQENNGRIYCLLHVLHDKTFLKYQKKMTSHDMNLYRGFCFELNTEKAAKSSVKAPSQINFDNGKENLMLKMKLLPYMVRTFCCRNGIRTISLNGPAAFENYTLKMMNSWQISTEAKSKWQDFFRSWGHYVHHVLSGADKSYIDTSLPPLTDQFYLNHLEYFIQLFKKNQLKFDNISQSHDSSNYKAMILVVAREKEMALQVAKFFSDKFGGVYLHDDISKITEAHLINMRVPQGGGLIAYASMEEGPKTIKRHVKIYGKYMSIILFGCDNESIESSSENRDRLLGVANSWRKLRVGLIKEVSIASLYDNSNTIREYQPTEEMDDALMSLSTFSSNVPALDNREGVLVFFPCIPGSGKSTLSSPASRYTMKEMLSALENVAAKQSSNERKLIVLVGDEVKQKYWPEVKKMRAENPSSLFVADKNTPPMAWGALSDSAGHGIIVPVLYKKTLSTTRIIGSVSSAGEIDCKKCHYYPFSLHYLVLCLARVLTRLAGTHIGGLDNSLKNAAMIMINFFGFYQNISAEDFFDTIKLKIERSGGNCCSRAVKVDFFTPDALPDLPSELSDALVDALRLRHGYNAEKKDITKFSCTPNVEAMEQRLRTVVSKYESFILGLTADEGKSRKDFMNEVVDIVRFSNVSNVNLTKAKEEQRTIKIVSVDVSLSTLQNVIKDAARRQPEIDKALRSLGVDVDAPWGKKCNNGVVETPHVTMAHCSDVSQTEMKTRFAPGLGNTIGISSTSLFWNEDIAALAVEVASISREGSEIPPSANNFVHITLWKGETIQASSSNKLPSLVEEGRASKIDFPGPLSFQGKLTFWHN